MHNGRLKTILAHNKGAEFLSSPPYRKTSQKLHTGVEKGFGVTWNNSIQSVGCFFNRLDRVKTTEIRH